MTSEADKDRDQTSASSSVGNPKWLAYSDRLVEGLRKAGMPKNKRSALSSRQLV